MGDNYNSNQFFCTERIWMFIQFIFDCILLADIIFYTHTSKQLHNSSNALLIIIIGLLFLFSLLVNFGKHEQKVSVARKTAKQLLLLITARATGIVFFLVFFGAHSFVTIVIEALALAATCITLNAVNKHIIDN